jgi:hypothetical protein
MLRNLGRICFLFVVGFSVLYCFWHYEIEPGFLWHRSLDQVSVIENAIMIYNETHTNPPNSIDVLVNAGRLPRISSLYASPLKYERQAPKPVPYSDSDYEIIVEGKDTMIRLKASVLNQATQVWRLRKLNYRAIGCRVAPDSRVVSGPDPLKLEGR